MTLQQGQVLKQQYCIIQPVGQGGMGAVYKAEDIHPKLGKRPVAIKEIIRDSKMSPQEIKEAEEAFEQEAVILRNLQHQNLPRIYDYFDDTSHNWYLVMDFIPGETLEEYLDKKVSKSLKMEEVLDIGIQLCTVLGYLHKQQPPIIFRDLKPSNIMRTPDGHIYLIDFGIARHFQPGKTKNTRDLGTPGYASPEHYKSGGQQTTPRSDLYGLGAILHHMLSGNNPEDNSPTIFDFPQLSLLVPSIPSELADLIMQMVEKYPTNRPPSAIFVKQKLQQIQTLLSMPPQVHVKPPQPPRPVPPAPAPHRQIQIHQPPPKVQAPPIKPVVRGRTSIPRSAWIKYLIVVVVLWGSIGAGAAFLTHLGSSQPSSPPTIVSFTVDNSNPRITWPPTSINLTITLNQPLGTSDWLTISASGEPSGTSFNSGNGCWTNNGLTCTYGGYICFGSGTYQFQASLQDSNGNPTDIHTLTVTCSN